MLILIFSSSSYAGIVNGQTDVRQKPDSILIYRLNDGAFVRECFKEGNWYKIEFEAYTSIADFNTLPIKRIKTFDKFGNENGTAIN